jgi:hypothetical protein
MRRINILTFHQYITESQNTDTNLILYHGSNNRKIFNNFFDDQFYTVNDYIASNYAYNFGGLMYEVKVNKLNAFELKGYNKLRESDKYNEMINLLTNLYDEGVAHFYERRYFSPSPSSTFGKYGWKPLIDWCKKNGFDSIKFQDESFDTFVRDITYLIFDGNKPKINSVYEVEDAVESNFSKDFKKIK